MAIAELPSWLAAEQRYEPTGARHRVMQQNVLRLASRWSVDPTTLGSQHASAGLGFIALAPLSWRAERTRKAA